jgi:hypothetical protein
MLIVMPVFALPFESRYYALVQNAMFVAVVRTSAFVCLRLSMSLQVPEMCFRFLFSLSVRILCMTDTH